jgi:hypothetical protein
MSYMQKTYKIEILKKLLKTIQGTNLNSLFDNNFFSHTYTQMYEIIIIFMW